MAKAKTVTNEAKSVLLDLPIGDIPGHGYDVQQANSGRVSVESRGLHVDAQLGRDAAIMFIRIRNGMRERNAKLESGRPVWSNADALRCMMEQASKEQPNG